jgi:L-Ala-D/L-Glu epimerase
VSRISAIQVYRADLPLLRRLEHASASEPLLEEVFLRLLTTAGGWGLAEIRGNGAYATGTDTATLVREISHRVGTALIGVELAEASDRVGEICDVPLARALADAAVLDATARETGVPMWRILGGQDVGAIPTHAQIGFCGLAQTVAYAHSAAEAGFRRIKIRVGRPDAEEDVAIVRAARDAIGDNVALALDANGAWEPETAERVLRQLEPSAIVWVEQPTAVGDDAALHRVRQASGIPVVADEAVRNDGDIERLSEAGAIDGVHLKLEKAGTAGRLTTMARRARAAGLLVCIGQMDQGRLGSSVTAHLAASIDADAYELWGFQNIAKDVAEGLDVRDGRMIMPSGPGTGVSVRLDVLTLISEVR